MSAKPTSNKSPADRFHRLYLEALELNLTHPEQRQPLLRQLALDDRFLGVLALILEHRASYLAAIEQQSLAAHHGCLEHCAGSCYAIAALLEDIQAALAA